MSKVFQFGEIATGYDIPVLNEREIRAASGIYLFFVLTGVVIVNTTGNFHTIKYVVTIFLVDLLIRLLISPRYSPSLILGRFIVRNQNPEYVGAPQKRFAWGIGVFISGTVFVHLVLLNLESPITGLGCLFCLIFLFFETAFGICIGCKLYPLVKRGEVQYCPGEVCDPKTKKAIQKISIAQTVILIAAIIGVIGFVVLTRTSISPNPVGILGNQNIR